MSLWFYTAHGVRHPQEPCQRVYPPSNWKRRMPVATRAMAKALSHVIGSPSSRKPTMRTSAVEVPPMMSDEVMRSPCSYARRPKVSTPAAAMPANARSHTASARRAISWPRARITSITMQFTTKAAPVMTMAARATLMRAAPSLRHTDHVAAEAPARTANSTADRIIRRASEAPPQDPGHADREVEAEEHHAQDQPQRPELRAGDVAAAVVHGRGPGGVGGENAHHAEGVAEGKGPALRAQAGHGDGEDEEERQQSRGMTGDGGEEVVHEEEHRNQEHHGHREGEARHHRFDSGGHPRNELHLYEAARHGHQGGDPHHGVPGAAIAEDVVPRNHAAHDQEHHAEERRRRGVGVAAAPDPQRNDEEGARQHQPLHPAHGTEALELFSRPLGRAGHPRDLGRVDAVEERRQPHEEKNAHGEKPRHPVDPRDGHPQGVGDQEHGEDVRG